jgi:hypothetical protein
MNCAGMCDNCGYVPNLSWDWKCIYCHSEVVILG